MHKSTFQGQATGNVVLDLCFSCQVLWLDPGENLRLAPAGVHALMQELYAHRGDAHLPLSHALPCPRCTRHLDRGFDVVRNGRYTTYRCPQRHGRMSTFSAFMVEKGLVRQLHNTEIQALAQKVGVLRCDGCGAPVDLRHDTVCPHCRSPFSMLDTTALARALQTSASAPPPAAAPAFDLGDALVALERERQTHAREMRNQRVQPLTAPSTTELSLWSIGIGLVGALLNG